jgi:hypothetical protein
LDGDLTRLRFPLVVVALASVTTVTGCAGDLNRGEPGQGAEAGRMAPGCGPGFNVTPTGGRYNEGATLAQTTPGRAVTVVVTMRVQRATTIRQLQLVVGKPGSTSGAGSGREAPAESMLLRQNQVAVVDLFSGPAETGQKFTASVALPAPGRYPVEALATSVSPGMCGGIETRPDDDMQSAQPIGFIAVH